MEAEREERKKEKEEWEREREALAAEKAARLAEGKQREDVLRSKVDKLRSQARQMATSDSHSPVMHRGLLAAERYGHDDDEDVGKKRRWDDSENCPAKKVPRVTITDNDSIA